MDWFRFSFTLIFFNFFLFSGVTDSFIAQYFEALKKADKNACIFFGKSSTLYLISDDGSVDVHTGPDAIHDIYYQIALSPAKNKTCFLRADSHFIHTFLLGESEV